MLKYILIVTLSILIPATAQSKYIYEYLEDIEPLLIERKYSEAETKFNNLNKKVQSYSVKGTGSMVSHLFNDTIIYLKEVDNFRKVLDDANKEPSKYEANGDYGVSEKGCQGRDCKYVHKSMIQSKLPKTLPFSSQFVEYLNGYHKETIDIFNTTNAHLAELKRLEKEQIKREREAQRKIKQEEQKQKRDTERLAREAEKKKEKDILDAEILKIDNASKKLGFKGFAKQNVVSLIYTTQQKGGLENYLNTVVGCPNQNQKSCKKWYPKVKAIQVLDQGVLYSFSEFTRNELFSFTIYVEKEDGKIYQEGQSLGNSFYVFKGMFSYSTVTGSTKTVPSFSKTAITY